jgi:hypothetical protein
MSWPPFEQLLWQIQAELGAIRAMLHSNREEYTERLDKIEDRLNRDRINWRDLLPALMPAILGIILVVLVISGRMTMQQAVSTLFGR